MGPDQLCLGDLHRLALVGGCSVPDYVVSSVLATLLTMKWAVKDREHTWSQQIASEVSGMENFQLRLAKTGAER